MKFLNKLLAVVPVLALMGAAAQAGDVKVGSAGGVTGPIAELVDAIMKGRQLAADHVNSNGGLLQGAPNGEEVYREWHHHWLFGLIPSQEQIPVDVKDYCPSGNATIDNQQTFLNGLVAALIGFLYAPTTVSILCDDGTQAEVELSGDEVAQIVNDPLFVQIVAEQLPERLAEVEAARASTSGWALGR